MIKAMVRAVGAGQLVYGSGRPAIDATPRPDALAPLGQALLSANPYRLLTPVPREMLA
jgi:hypothetical protein